MFFLQYVFHSSVRIHCDDISIAVMSSDLYVFLRLLLLKNVKKIQREEKTKKC